jgi:hypothetical protein
MGKHWELENAPVTEHEPYLDAFTPSLVLVDDDVDLERGDVSVFVPVVLLTMEVAKLATETAVLVDVIVELSIDIFTVLGAIEASVGRETKEGFGIVTPP